ncbi:MAG TPA: hypothetical protein VJ742_13040 [Nitrososphaera sp.]|nr:hypothetical protein [Nitrososphaera sp.]
MPDIVFEGYQSVGIVNPEAQEKHPEWMVQDHVDDDWAWNYSCCLAFSSVGGICFGIGGIASFGRWSLLLLPIALFCVVVSLFCIHRLWALNHTNPSDFYIKFGDSHPRIKAHELARRLTEATTLFVQATEALNGPSREYLIRDLPLLHREAYSIAISIKAFEEAKPFAVSSKAVIRYDQAFKELEQRVDEFEKICETANDIVFRIHMEQAERGQITSGFLEHLVIMTRSLQESLLTLDGIENASSQ